ncbi:UDP-N-acetylmuramate dehydrogenase [Friedmanniella luteola]|uniref:UDP-N-acetylenolpyruvoylglucosamine reductase n=1 Tax=Friedmanniella luteola TaxID=546871 RepID=A0A1H1Z526_9ACTN|nr:UDP-N-acetylmuramate dehydrogenase [Friedmanniella luteola]SDT28770.1 UDP-N-acetylmuramate dehydrogenase [Friedmanniella luteola]
MAEASVEAVSTSLAAHTTLRVGGPARRVLVRADEAALVQTVRELDAAGEPVLVLGGGSNVLVGDEGFDGTVVKVATRGVAEDVAACSGAVLTVAAGEPWEDLVRHTLEHEYAGLETLAGIPGSVGGTPIQNVGAYGTEVGQLITTVRTLDRSTGAIRTFFAVECQFGYRSSRFKSEPGRHLVLAVTFQLKLGSLSAPVRYPELARALGIAVGERAPARDVAEAVLALRRGKGMVLDDADPDTWSAGSFFTNPVLAPAQADALPADAPRFPQPDGRVKTSAAWLIERAGYGRGFGEGPARVSDKHSLALTNRGSARASDLLRLARQIRAGVESTYGITLVPEPVLVGCEL